MPGPAARQPRVYARRMPELVRADAAGFPTHPARGLADRLLSLVEPRPADSIGLYRRRLAPGLSRSGTRASGLPPVPPRVGLGGWRDGSEAGGAEPQRASAAPLRGVGVQGNGPATWRRSAGWKACRQHLPGAAVRAAFHPRMKMRAAWHDVLQNSGAR